MRRLPALPTRAVLGTHPVDALQRKPTHQCEGDIWDSHIYVCGRLCWFWVFGSLSGPFRLLPRRPNRSSLDAFPWKYLGSPCSPCVVFGRILYVFSWWSRGVLHVRSHAPHVGVAKWASLLFCLVCAMLVPLWLSLPIYYGKLFFSTCCLSHSILFRLQCRAAN